MSESLKRRIGYMLGLYDPKMLTSPDGKRVDVSIDAIVRLMSGEKPDPPPRRGTHEPPEAPDLRRRAEGVMAYTHPSDMTPEQLRERIRALFHGAHHVDIVVRRGGKDEHHEGDWLKYLLPECRPMTPPDAAAREESRNE